MVVREHAHRVARPELGADLGEIAIGPVVHDLVGHREPLHRREHGARVADRDAVAEHLGDARERGGEVDGTEDDHAGRERERLDEHRHVLFARFAVLAVVARRGEAGFELAERVACDDAVEVRVAERTHDRIAGPDEQLGADVRAGDDGDERDRFAGAQRVPQLLVDRHQSIGSTNRWIVPPQVRPTANASSSE